MNNIVQRRSNAVGGKCNSPQINGMKKFLEVGRKFASVEKNNTFQPRAILLGSFYIRAVTGRAFLRSGFIEQDILAIDFFC